MIAVKEKIKTLVDTMPVWEAERLFSYINANFQLVSNETSWDAIKEVEPDDIDKQMLYEMEHDPDCNDFS